MWMTPKSSLNSNSDIVLPMAKKFWQNKTSYFLNFMMSGFSLQYIFPDSGGFRVYFSSSLLTTLKLFTQFQAWQGYQDLYLNTTFLQVSTLAKLMNPNYNPSTQDPLLLSQITQVLYFEWSLANNYSTLDSVRRHYNRSYNPMTITEASAAYSFINWANFLDQLLVFAPQEVPCPSVD